MDRPAPDSRHATNDGAAAPDLQSLALFRIAFAVYLLGDFCFNILPFFDEFYRSDGILSLAAMAGAPYLAGQGFTLWALQLVEAVGLPTIFPILYPLALVAFGLGYRTRSATIIAFALHLFLYWRNPQLDSGAEILAHLLLLWCLFLPIGSAWSIDAALDPVPARRKWPALPFLAIRLQIASLYLFAALFKLAGPPWREGIALAQAMGDNLFGATPMSLFLLDHAAPLLRPATYLVIAFQLAFPFLIYSPWRNDAARAVALIGAALMHLGFILCLNVGGFPYLCFAMLLLLVPDRWLDRLLRRRRERLARVTIYYDPECDFCRRVSLLLRAACLAPTSQVLPASADPDALRLLTEHGSWVVRGADGAPHLKWSAVAHVLKQHPIFAAIGLLTDAPALRAPFARLYDAIGANRHRLGSIASRLLPLAPQQAIGRPALALCGFLMALAFASNLASVWRLYAPAPVPLDRLAAALQVKQSWDLFAPRPTHWRRDFRIRVLMADGTDADLLPSLPARLFEPAAGGALDFVNHRWLKFFTRIDSLPEPERAAFGAWLCRQAVARVGPAARTVRFTETKQLIDDSPAPESVYDYRFACAPERPVAFAAPAAFPYPPRP